MPVFTLDNIDIHVTRKRIKNLHLRVRAPDGQVTLSIPHRISDAYVIDFISSRLMWIKKHQAKLINDPPAPAALYENGEQHPFLGESYPLSVIATSGKSGVRLINGRLLLSCRPGSETRAREKIFREWHKKELTKRVPAHIARHASVMGVLVAGFSFRKMRSRWGSCNIRDKRISLNTELAKYPEDCLEYVVVHEMAHLLERGHNARFHALMTRFFPHWRDVKKTLTKRL